MSTLNKLRVIGAVCVALGASNAIGASQTQINNAIDNGLAYLASQQTGGGYWNSQGYAQAETGAAVFAMLTQQSQWGSNASAYQTDVINGINYLLSTATTNTVSTRNDGANICSGGGSCTGVYWSGNGEATYTTGQVAMAIAEYGNKFGGGQNAVATTSGPLAGMTWGQIAQGIVNEYSASQSSSINGNKDGGWRYYIPGNGDSDMSTTQWAVLSMIYGQTLGATAPQTVKDHLQTWLTAVQVSGQGGAACYQPNYLLCEQADTGGLLLSLNFLGKTKSDPAVQAAIGFLNSHWTEGAYNTWYGNFGQPYAMWAEYKGLELNIGLADTTSITNLLDPTCGGNSPTTCNWWQDYNQWLVQNQNSNGSWNGYVYWGSILTAAYDLPILGGAQIPPPPPPGVPEPATLGLVATGLILLAQSRRKRIAS